MEDVDEEYGRLVPALPGFGVVAAHGVKGEVKAVVAALGQALAVAGQVGELVALVQGFKLGEGHGWGRAVGGPEDTAPAYLRAMPTLRFPHPLVLLTLFIALAAGLSYVLPAGRFLRRPDPATGRAVVVPGSYRRLPPTPVSAPEALLAIPKGLQDAAGVIFFVFLTGGAFTVIDRTGALGRGVDALLGRLRSERAQGLVIPLVSVLFATMGALENMQEEIIPLVPVLLVLMRRLGYPALTAAAVSVGAAAVGAAFSPLNPFQVGIAQQLAQLPLLSGGGFRLVFLLLAVALWTFGTWRFAVRRRVLPAAEIASADAANNSPSITTNPSSSGAYLSLATRQLLVLFLVLATFGVFTYGILKLEWGFEQMGALFLLLGVAAGLLGGLGPNGTADAFVAGFRDLAFSAMLIGFARAIFVVLEQGQIVDTVVQGLATPLQGLPVGLAAVGMVGLHTVLHLPVPSVSGQAVLTMPLLVPLSDLIGLSRQVTVLAFQYGAGLCELITPTNGALVAVVAACGGRFDEWLRMAWPLYLSLLALALVAVGLGLFFFK